MKKLWVMAALVTALGMPACGTARAQHARAEKEPCAVPGEDNSFLGIQTYRLWPGKAPEAHGDACEDIPTITEFDPQPGTANGSAAVIFPGGAYVGLAGNLEGRQVADWFAARGFRAFIVSYRLSSNGYLLPVPLLDARRAIQTVRARAGDYHIDPNRIVLIGFSAGGHLAALAATKFVKGDPDAEDAIDRVSSRPDYLVLGYPWIGAISPDTSHLSYCALFHVMDRCAALRAAYSPDLFVTKQTPPTFWYHTFDDQTVPVEQGLKFYEALVKAGVPSEAHIFFHGPHGTGLGKGDESLDQWPRLLETWLRVHGLMTKSQAATRP
ncbi:MAG TPA: alpha/beta hydrolase [Terracidiphilus sp.]|nr:alpha/beta hydrolase [Terracidiphilus sp.]